MLPSMTSRVLLVALALSASMAGPSFAQPRSAYLQGGNGAAVDAKGVRHHSRNYPGRLPPWMQDRTHSVAPDYPYLERRMNHTGSGYFELTLDLKTGAVRKVSIRKSTRFPGLDDCAVAALRQWRWRPGKWKTIETGVTFVISRSEPRMSPGAVRLPLPESPKRTRN